MAYKVVVMPRAEADLEEAHAFIALDSVPRAEKWLSEALDLILSLRDQPGRFSMVPEYEKLGRHIHDALHYSHRVVFRIREEEKRVEVLRVWHCARGTLRESSD